MNLTATQIEDIVRVVVERLRADVAAPTVQAATPRSVELTAGEVHLSDRVVTLESLKDKTSGTKSIVVHPKAVVTPAVKDFLRQQSIRLVRQLPMGTAKASRPAPLLLVTSERQHSIISKRVCSQQANTIAASDAASTAAVIGQNLTNGKRGAVWCTETPFACVAATYGHPNLRAIQLSDLQDFSSAIEQAQPNVLIVDCRKWNAPSIANLVRQWFGRLG